MSNLRFLLMLTVGYGLVWLLAVGVATNNFLPSTPILQVIAYSSLASVISLYPAGAISVYLSRQTGQRRWLGGFLVAFLAAAGIIGWSVWQFGSIGLGEYRGLGIAITAIFFGFTLSVTLTVVSALSKHQHRLTRWAGLVTFLTILIGIGTDIVARIYGNHVLGIWAVFFILTTIVGLVTLFSSAYFGKISD